MRLIGLTGSIGSGKTTAAKCFQKLGADIIDADELAREVVMVGKTAYLELLEVFGPGILLPDRTLDRSRLAKIAFNDKAALSQLNRITHREIKLLRRLKINEILKNNPQSTIICDIPLLFETNMQSEFQLTVLITIDAEIQVNRLMSHRNLKLDDIKARLRNQMPQVDKIKLADITILNNGGVEELSREIKKIYFEKIQKLPQLHQEDEKRL